MGSYAWLRRKAVVLAVMLMLEYTGVSAAPRSAISLEPVPATSQVNADGSDPDLSTLEGKAVAERQTQSEIKHIFDTAADDEMYSYLLSAQETLKDKLTRKTNTIARRRNDMVTEDLQSKTLHIMEDVNDYDVKTKSLGDVIEMVRVACGEDVVTAVSYVLDNLGDKDDQDVTTVLTTVALLQFHQCPSAALTITSRLLAAVSDHTGEDSRRIHGPDRSHGPKVELSASRFAEDTGNEKQQGRPDAFSHVRKTDYCSHLPECDYTGIPAVREQLAEHPSLLVVYDVAVAAVFSQGHSGFMAKALVDDITGELNITAPGAEFHVPRHTRISKRSGCEDKTESEVQSVVSWIPFIGTLYNLISAAVYAGKGCNDVAEQRAIEGTIDVAMDVATVATIGTGAALFQGAKTVAKGATKQVVKATIKKTFKKVTKNLAKQTLKGYKNPIKGAIREVKDTVKGVVSLAKAAPKLVKAAPKLVKKGGQAIKSGVQRLTKTGTKGAVDSGFQAAGKSVAKSGSDVVDNARRGIPDLDDVADNARRNIPDPDDASKAVRRCKRSGNGPCEIPIKSSQDSLLDSVDYQYGRRGSSQVRNTHAGRWDDLWNRYKITDEKLLPHTLKGDLYKNIKGIDLTGSTLSNKQLFETLQEQAVGNAPLYVKQNLGGVNVEYIASRQPYKNSNDQIVIKVGVLDANGVPRYHQPATYLDITKKLDQFSNKFPNPAMKRHEMADAMRKAIYDSPDAKFNQNFRNVFGNDPAAKQAAGEFVVITQLAEAVPGRIKGNDAYFRGGLKAVSEGRWTFQQFYNRAGLAAKPKGLGHAKTFVRGSNPDERMRALLETGSDPDAVHRVFKDMSDPDRRRRR